MCRHAPRTPDDTAEVPPVFTCPLSAELGPDPGRRSSHCQHRGSSETSETAGNPVRTGFDEYAGLRQWVKAPTIPSLELDYLFQFILFDHGYPPLLKA